MAPEAAGVIHTDFERGFIKAEVCSFEDFKTLCDGKKSMAPIKVSFYTVILLLRTLILILLHRLLGNTDKKANNMSCRMGILFISCSMLQVRRRSKLSTGICTQPTLSKS